MNNDPFTQPVQAGDGNFYGNQPEPTPQPEQPIQQPEVIAEPTPAEPVQQFQPDIQTQPQAPYSAEPPKKKSKVGLIIIIAVIALLAIFGGIGFFVYSSFKAANDTTTDIENTAKEEAEKEAKEQEEYDNAKIEISYGDTKFTIHRTFADTVKSIVKNGGTLDTYEDYFSGKITVDSKNVDDYLDLEHTGDINHTKSDVANGILYINNSSALISVYGTDDTLHPDLDDDEEIKLKHINLDFVSFSFAKTSETPLKIDDKTIYLNKTTRSEMQKLFPDNQCDDLKDSNYYNYNGYGITIDSKTKDADSPIESIDISRKGFWCSDELEEVFGS